MPQAASSDALSRGIHGGTRDVPYIRDDFNIRVPLVTVYMHEPLLDGQRSAHGCLREALPKAHSPMDARRV